MGLMGSWNGFSFEVSPSVVRSFTGLTIKGGSETEDKVSDKQKYVERKNSAVTEISMSVYLNAYMGCNVRDEAITFINAAMKGEANYFYVGGRKLVSYQLMLTQAEITETEISPTGTWIACKIGLTMKQCEKNGLLPKGSSSGSSSSKKAAKSSVVDTTVAGSTAETAAPTGNNPKGLDYWHNEVTKVTDTAKAYSKVAIGGSQSQIAMIAMK